MFSAYKKLLFGDPSGIIESIYSVCTNPWHTFNKPPLMFATFQGNFIPYSSFVSNNSELAKVENAITDSFVESSPHGIRSESSNMMRRIKHSLNFKFHQLLVELRQEGYADDQMTYFRNKWSELLELKEIFVHAILAKKVGGGNCGEHSKIALADLITLKYNKHIHEVQKGVTSFTIQEINFFGKGDGHALVFINSNLPDKRIFNNATAVTEFFKNAVGIVCDTWNNGVVSSLEVDLTGIFNPGNYNGYGYSGATVVTRDIPLKEIAQMPEKMQNLFCEVLEDMGINMRNALQAVKETKEVSREKKPKLKPKAKPKPKPKAKKSRECTNPKQVKKICTNDYMQLLEPFLTTPNYRHSQCFFQPNFLPYPQTCPATPQGLVNAGFGNLIGR